MPPIVVNMRTCDPPWGRPGDVRIDRETKWGNPYPLSNTVTRCAAIKKYSVYLMKRLAEKSLDISELKNAKRLGCWCKPKACHGDILVKAMRDQRLIT